MDLLTPESQENKKIKPKINKVNELIMQHAPINYKSRKIIVCNQKQLILIAVKKDGNLMFLNEKLGVKLKVKRRLSFNDFH